MPGSFASTLALASLLASGCAASARAPATIEIGAAAPGSPAVGMIEQPARPSVAGAERWVGAWEDAETAGHTHLTVRLVSGIPTAVSAIESRGDLETMEIRRSQFGKAGLEYHYFVPSTRYLVMVSCGSVTPDTMECTWSNNHQASGKSTLTRVSPSRPSE